MRIEEGLALNLMSSFARLRRRLARTVACSLAACLVLVGPARAEPALWLIQDQDSRIYLFGTVHILPPDTQWRSPRIDAAIADASELWLEIPNITSIGAQIVAAVAVLSQGFSFKHPLSTRLTPEQFASLDKAAEPLGYTARDLNVMRPWLAALLLQTGGAGATTMEPGVDVQLEKEFNRRGAPVSGFETVGQQIGIFSKLPEQDELSLLLDTIASVDTSGDDFAELVSIWETGDSAAMEKAVITDMKAGSSALYDAMLKNRNAAWADQIQTLLAGKGTIFIAVGAAHLAGPDSVQAQLKAKGIVAERR
jgi:uncharacterized protein